MGITKSGTRVTCTVDGSKGYSVASAFTMNDIFDESEANGWGMIKNIVGLSQLLYVFYVPFSIYIDDDTYFIMYQYGKQLAIFFNCEVPDDYYPFFSRNKSHVLIGREGSGSNQDPVMISVVGVANSTSYRRMWFAGDIKICNLHLFGSNYTYLLGSAADNAQAIMKNSFLHDLNFALQFNDSAEMYNVQRNKGTYGFWANTIEGTAIMEDCVIVYCYYGILCQGYYNRAKGIKIINSEYGDTYMRCGNGGDKVSEWVDCTIDKAKIGWYNSGSTPNTLNEQFLISTTTFHIKDVNNDPVSGASVKVYSAQDTLLFEGITDENGEIIEEEIKYYYAWRIASGAVTDDEGSTDYEPLRIVISKSPFRDTEINDIYIVSGQPTVIYATLYEEVYYDRALSASVSAEEIMGSVYAPEVAGEVYAVEIEAEI